MNIRHIVTSKPFLRIYIIIALLSVLTGFFLFKKIFSPVGALDYEGKGEGRSTVLIREGQDLTSIGNALVVADVIASLDAFVKATRENPDSQNIQPGTYELPRRMSSANAIDALLDLSNKVVTKIVIPEGTTVETIIDIASGESYLPRVHFEKIVKKPIVSGLPGWSKKNLEGFLFPATYMFNPTDTAQDILETMVKSFKSKIARLHFTDRAKKLGVTPRDALIIASILEREVHANDMPKASRVIYNRLAKDMLLQMDSTINYGLNQNVLQLTQSDLDNENPYNTYVHKGLPPGPIGNPGSKALEAAVNPAKGSWLYFVTVNPDTGKTKFSTSYNDFLNDKAEYTRWLKENT